MLLLYCLWYSVVWLWLLLCCLDIMLSCYGYFFILLSYYGYCCIALYSLVLLWMLLCYHGSLLPCDYHYPSISAVILLSWSDICFCCLGCYFGYYSMAVWVCFIIYLTCYGCWSCVLLFIFLGTCFKISLCQWKVIVSCEKWLCHVESDSVDNSESLMKEVWVR